MTKKGWRGNARSRFVWFWLLFLGGAAQAQAPPADGEAIGVPYLIPPAAVPLNEQQRDKIAALRRELHDRYCTLSGELLHAQEEMRAQMARQPRSPEGVAEASRRAAEIRDRIRAARAEAEAQAAALLTPKQRALLARWREEQRRAGGAAEDVPYTVLPGIPPQEPDIENREDPTRMPRY